MPEQKQDRKPSEKPAEKPAPKQDDGIVYLVNGTKVDANGKPVKG